LRFYFEFLRTSRESERAAAYAPKDDWIVMLSDHAAGALRVERTLHEGFFREFKLSPEHVLATPLCPYSVSVDGTRWARSNARARR
jgi:hypothetical protein